MTIEFDLGSLLQTIGLIILAIFVLVSIFMLFRGIKRWFRSMKYDRTDLSSMRRRWTEIKSMANSNSEVSRKLAIMEADKLLDMALKNLYMAGDTLGERLKFAAHKLNPAHKNPANVSTINRYHGVWSTIHKSGIKGKHFEVNCRTFRLPT
jgi:hypothetical protein